MVGSNKAGNNIFFIRNDLTSNFNILAPEDAYQVSQFRESRDENGKLTFNNIKDNLKAISDLEMINVETQESIKIKHLF